jgi:hypothetical protein
MISFISELHSFPKFYELEGITFGDPLWGTLQSQTNPDGFLFIFLSALSENSGLRPPKLAIKKLAVVPMNRDYGERRRREGDSNPRYPFEVHTLSRRAS